MAITGKWHGCHFKKTQLTAVNVLTSYYSEIIKSGLYGNGSKTVFMPNKILHNQTLDKLLLQYIPFCENK